MPDHEDESTSPHASAGTTAAAVYSYVPSNFPIPAPMVCKGNLVANWGDYEVANGLDKQSSKIRLASFRPVMGKIAFKHS